MLIKSSDFISTPNTFRKSKEASLDRSAVVRHSVLGLSNLTCLFGYAQYYAQ
ncbi:hypothetical protein [Spirosoma sp. KNUC1025]|uniref:hypothetical protein n=1 Tax=Spirosoma sp. KNUC1025 TaxID=2894082 RepID=UPI001E5F39DB|nr:hypothetical protein [Spirosoma sp. KNUC1025]UFH57701.1 hypothetical protein LN737_32250 [Spirosoma sp. KNUC1025]